MGLGQTRADENSFSLKTFANFLNENLAKRDSNFIKGLKIREVQQLSELHKIIEVELPSDFARSSLSQQNLSRENTEATGAVHSTTFLKPKTDGS